MYRNPSDFLIVNGVRFPCPSTKMSITSSKVVDSGRNTNGAVVGQLIGRKLWKIDNLEWHGLDAEQWAEMQRAIEPFFVPVEFTDSENVRRTVYMYPSDVKSDPLFLNGVYYKNFVNCSFNLIDCGW